MRLKYTVYTIRDDKGEVIYVGRTHHSPESRFNSHKNAKTKLGAWIRQHIDDGKKVDVVIEKQWLFDRWGCPLYHTASHESWKLERELIAHYYELRGDSLFNINCTRKKQVANVYTAEEYAAIQKNKQAS